MRVYYNDIDPHAGAWLARLIAAGALPAGEVDGRSLLDVPVGSVPGDRPAHWFAGIGGWPLALRLAGVPDDVPVWTGSAPCQPFSVAGLGLGYDDPRHLAPAWLVQIEAARPPIVLGEQVASRAAYKWLADLRGRLTALGYTVIAVEMPAAWIGAPHIRARLWFAAWRGEFLPVGQGRSTNHGPWAEHELLYCRDNKWRPVNPAIWPLAPTMPRRAATLRGYGNAIVPQVAAEFIRAVASGDPVAWLRERGAPAPFYSARFATVPLDGFKLPRFAVAPLRTDVTGWPTATARDHFDGRPNPNVARYGALGRTVWMASAGWPTASASDAQPQSPLPERVGAFVGAPSPRMRRRIDAAPDLWRHDYAPILCDPATGQQRPAEPAPDADRLNPEFARWLMGYPAAWGVESPINHAAEHDKISRAHRKGRG